jgi:hypothetical protein
MIISRDVSIIHRPVIPKLLEIFVRTDSQPPVSCQLSQYARTPLHYAAEGGHTEVVSLLLDKGANIEAKDKVCRLQTILFLATVIITDPPSAVIKQTFS